MLFVAQTRCSQAYSCVRVWNSKPALAPTYAFVCADTQAKWAFIFRVPHIVSCACKNGAQRPPAVFGSGIRTLPCALSWTYYPVPCHPLASTPHHLSAPQPPWHPIADDILHRAQGQSPGGCAGYGYDCYSSVGLHSGRFLVSIPPQRLRGQTQNMIECIGHWPQLPARRKVDHLPPDTFP